MQRISLMCLAFALVITSLAIYRIADGELPSNSASDIPKQYRAAVAYVTGQNIMHVDSDGHFHPFDAMTRAEFLQAVVLAQGHPPSASVCHPYFDMIKQDGSSIYYFDGPFADISSGSRHAPYICSTRNQHIIQGYPDGTFRPDIAITYADAIPVIAKALPRESLIDTAYNQSAIEALAKRGAIPETAMALDANVTRIDVAEILFRLKTSTSRLPSLTYRQLTKSQCGDGVCQANEPGYQTNGECPKDCAASGSGLMVGMIACRVHERFDTRRSNLPAVFGHARGLRPHCASPRACRVPTCPQCSATHGVRNGATHSGKPSFRCRACGRRFVADPAKGPVPTATRDLVRRLLLERMGLRAIRRSVGVSQLPECLAVEGTRYATGFQYRFLDVNGPLFAACAGEQRVTGRGVDGPSAFGPALSEIISPSPTVRGR